MIIGLTGGSGTGKSVVLHVFKALGYATYSSDEAAKKIYFDPIIKEKIIQLLGEAAYSNGLLNKAFIRDAIFNNTSLRSSLNAIIHPAVANDFQTFFQSQKGPVIQESALLFEAGLDKRCDKIIVVTASEATRIKRLQERDQLTKEAILLRFGTQLPEHSKIEKADFVIQNNDGDHLLDQVLQISEKIIHAHP